MSTAIPRKIFLKTTAAAVAALTGCRQKPTPADATVKQNEGSKFADRILSDTAVAMLGFGAYIGDRLGIYRAMAEAGPSTVEDLAARTGLRERYLREWLALMATAGYVRYDAGTQRYELPRDHVEVLCDENSPIFMAGFIESLACVFPTAKVIEGFRGGKGPVSEDYPPEHWEGIERSTAPSYRNLLAQSYIPAMQDIDARLRQGGAALDLGCGAGIASIAVAKAYPKTEVFGYDIFAPSIEKARSNAAGAGLADRIRFETYDGMHLPADRFDLITVCYTLHHFQDPVKNLASAGKALKKGGAVLVMEANVPEKMESSVGNTWANWNYGVSLFYCMSAVVTEGGPAFGAAIKESEVKALAEKAGFGHFRRLPIDNQMDALYELKVA